MSDGTPTLDQAPETASPEVDPGLLTQDPGLPVEEPTPEAPPVEDDLDEIEYDGDRYKVPKKLKDGFLMQADYTRKTQGIAEERKALQAAQEAVKKEAEAHRAHIQEVGRATVLNDQLAELDKVDWQKLGQDDPFKADELFRQRMLLREQRDSLIAKIQDNEHKRSQDTQQSFAKRYAETNEALAKDIKGWNQDLANKLVDFAKTNGATDDDIRTFAVNAPLVKLLHKAFLGDQLIQTKQTAAKTAEPKIEAKPLLKVTGNGAKSVPNLADADMETYVAQRKKQGFGKK